MEEVVGSWCVMVGGVFQVYLAISATVIEMLLSASAVG